VSVESYDLVLQDDVNTRGHNQWFYFKATSTRKHQRVRFNIVNLVKRESLFSYGLKPLAFIPKDPGVGWHRSGLRVSYEPNSLRREHQNASYYTLSFEYHFREAYESVFFAPSYPYPYSQLLVFLDRLLGDPAYQQCLSVKKLCESAGKNTLNLVSISTGKSVPSGNKVVWVLARQHPGETTSSFMAEGMVLHLLQLMAGASKEEASFYDRFVFKVVPMVNPDGVIHGNSRAELTGVDPNRAWKKASKSVTPSIHSIKKHILKFREETCLVLDLHSHSSKLGCFFYGNHGTGSVAVHRILPSLACGDDPRFSFKNCRFRGGSDKSARKALFGELGIPHVYTVECSQLGFIRDNRICEYTVRDYHEMGARIIETFFTLERQDAPATSYPHQPQDFCDAQSARSDSCASDDEYPEVYTFVKQRGQPKGGRKERQKPHSLTQTHKHHTSDHPRPPPARKEERSETIAQDHPPHSLGKRLVRGK
jgi:cytosolic carboxypeptidase protein 2/3